MQLAIAVGGNGNAGAALEILQHGAGRPEQGRDLLGGRGGKNVEPCDASVRHVMRSQVSGEEAVDIGGEGLRGAPAVQFVLAVAGDAELRSRPQCPHPDGRPYRQLKGEPVREVRLVAQHPVAGEIGGIGEVLGPPNAPAWRRLVGEAQRMSAVGVQRLSEADLDRISARAPIFKRAAVEAQRGDPERTAGEAKAVAGRAGSEDHGLLARQDVRLGEWRYGHVLMQDVDGDDSLGRRR